MHAVDAPRKRCLGDVALMTLQKRPDEGPLKGVQCPPACLGVGKAEMRVRCSVRRLLRRRVEGLLKDGAPLEVVAELADIP